MQEKKERNAKIVELYNEGVVLSEIGEMFGVTKERVRQIAKEAGCELRRPEGRSSPFIKTDEQRRTIEQLLREGYTHEVIASTQGVPTGSVSRVARNAGLLRQEKREHLYDEILERYEAGETYSQIGERYGVTRNVVAGAVMRAREKSGKEPDHRNKLSIHSKKVISKACKLRQSGKTLKQISKATGIPFGSVPYVLSKHEDAA